MRILFVSANPHWTARLDLGDEMRELMHSLRGQAVQLMLLPAAQPGDLKQAVVSKEISILHFSGHATEDEGIILRDEDGMERPVTGEELRGLIEGRNIKLAILNACSSEATAREIANSVGAVIATNQPLNDQAATESPTDVGAGHNGEVYVTMGAAWDDVLLPDATSDEADVSLEGQASYDKFYFISYLDEQIRDITARVRRNRHIFLGFLALGIIFWMYTWMTNFDKVQLLIDIFGEERLDLYMGKPYFDALIAIGAAIPALLSFFQNRLRVHGNQEIRSLTQMKELARASDDLPAELQSRLQKIMDQSIRGADLNYDPFGDWIGLFSKLSPAPSTSTSASDTRPGDSRQ